MFKASPLSRNGFPLGVVTAVRSAFVNVRLVKIASVPDLEQDLRTKMDAAECSQDQMGTGLKAPRALSRVKPWDRTPLT